MRMLEILAVCVALAGISTQTPVGGRVVGTSIGLILGKASASPVPEIRGLGRWLAGLSNCSLSQTIQASRDQKSLLARIKELWESSRVVQTDGGLEQRETAQGRFWIPAGIDLGDFFGSLVEQETNTYGTGRLGVQAGDVVLDCGANFGVYTRKALASGAKTVVAIDPVPACMLCLRRTFQREISEGRVILYPKGVWHCEGRLPMRVDPTKPESDSFVRQGWGTHELALPVTTIHRLVEELAVQADWLTNLPSRKLGSLSLYHMAQSRWEIENQGFNDVKNSHSL
jgi:FkbM family methyltransferase